MYTELHVLRRYFINTFNTSKLTHAKGIHVYYFAKMPDFGVPPYFWAKASASLIMANLKMSCLIEVNTYAFCVLSLNGTR